MGSILSGSWNNYLNTSSKPSVVSSCLGSGNKNEAKYLLSIGSFGKQISVKKERNIQKVNTKIKIIWKEIVGQSVKLNLNGLTMSPTVYTPKSRGFESQWDHWIYLIYLIISACNLSLGFTQPIREMPTRNSEEWNAADAYGSQQHLWVDCLGNVRSLIFHSTIGLHELLRG
jgi:hypothetical protein